MYFLVVDDGDSYGRAHALALAYGGELAQSSYLRFTRKAIAGFDLESDDGSNHMQVLHLAFGVAKRKDYGEIEATLKLMFGSRFLGRSRKRRDQ
jgi:hypothetical protein